MIWVIVSVVVVLLAGLLLALMLDLLPRVQLRLIDDWHRAWRFASTYALAAIAALPDLYNQMIMMHWLGGAEVPPLVSRILWSLTGLGFAGRLLKRVRDPKQDVTT